MNIGEQGEAALLNQQEKEVHDVGPHLAAKNAFDDGALFGFGQARVVKDALEVT